MSYSLAYKQEKAHDDSIWSVAWVKSDRDGVENIVTGSVDDTVKCWSWDPSESQLKLRHTMESSQLGVVSVDINSLGNLAVSSSMDSCIRLWDLEIGKRLKLFEASPTDVWSVCFTPDSRFIASSSHVGTVNLFALDSGKIESTLTTNGPSKFLLSVSVSPDGQYLAAGSIDGTVNVFDMSLGRILHRIEAHNLPVRCLCFSADSQILLTASDDGFVKMFDITHGTPLKSIPAHSAWILGIAFSPDNRHFVTSGADKMVKVWDAGTSETEHIFCEHSDQVWGVKYNSFGSCMVSVSDDASVNIYSCPAS